MAPNLCHNKNLFGELLSVSILMEYEQYLPTPALQEIFEQK
ncbi:MAG: hypothetical protein AAGE84_30605 [Cyanobacteria bacterium P01_G01_bin.39]